MTSLPKCPSRASRASSQPATRTVISSGLKAPLRTSPRMSPIRGRALTMPVRNVIPFVYISNSGTGVSAST
jgi:hypothetical protein